ncbi:hypothetical protein JVU11DRAFT_5432 [Chiua virens]|nr:hypothetical protein JVU11DRAFT_5432 [Chiua virens]
MASRAKAATAATRASTRTKTPSAPSPSPPPAIKAIKAKASTRSTSGAVTGGPATKTVVTRKPVTNRSNSPDGKQTAPKRAGKPTVTKSPVADQEPIMAYLRIRPYLGDDEPATMPYLDPLSDTAVRMTDPSNDGRSGAYYRASSTSPSSIYKFSHVFLPLTQQADFFAKTTLPLVQDLLDGQNSLLFAYGVTNSGKTYTIQGGNQSDSGGILPRTLDVIFNSIEGLQCDGRYRPARLYGVEEADPSDFTLPSIDIGVSSEPALAEVLAEHMASSDTSSLPADSTVIKLDRNYEYSVWISYVEVYNEKVYDLLASVSDNHENETSGAPRSAPTLAGQGTNGVLVTRKALAVKPSPAHDAIDDGAAGNLGRYISGLKQLRVTSAMQAKALVKLGQLHRRVFGTLANSQSSRSHSLITIKVLRNHRGDRDDPTSVQISRLTLVDLAGSERTKHTQTTGDRLKEAGNINKSLMVLGQCMEVMRSNQRRLAQSLANPGQSDTRDVKRGLAVVPFRHSKLTEILMDYFAGDGRVTMIVNVNPYDTGFDENSHVMKFSALAREISTVVNNAPVPRVHGSPSKPGSTPKPSGLPRAITRKVTISSVGPEKKLSEAHLEVLEEDEDVNDDQGSDEDPINPLVDALFDEIEGLRLKLYEAEMRCAIVEAETREEVMEEMEERMRAVERTYAVRLMSEVEHNERKTDAKIDMLHRAGLLGTTRSHPWHRIQRSECEEDSAQEHETYAKSEIPSSPLSGKGNNTAVTKTMEYGSVQPKTSLPGKANDNANAIVPDSHNTDVSEDEGEDQAEDSEISSDDDASDDYVPRKTVKNANNHRKRSTGDKASKGSTNKKSIRSVSKLGREIQGLSIEDDTLADESIVILPNKKAHQEAAESEGPGEVDSMKKKKRQLGKKNVVTEEEVEEVVGAMERRSLRKNSNATRLDDGIRSLSPTVVKPSPGYRRRAHSVAPGDGRLSPAAKARRSLAPRKSILKAAVNVIDDNDDATQSMDITRDYRDDNATRKSLGRRVSFANHAHVRLFEVSEQNTNSTTSPQSSPAAEPEPDTPRATNDENAYPDAPRSRRRSSARHSIAFSEGGGEESMEMDTDDTGFSPSAFLRTGNEATIDDEFNDWDGPSGGDDMDVTEVIPRNIVRNRSLSFGVSRRPLANLAISQSPGNVHDDVSNEVSYVEEDSAQSQSFASEGDVSQPMEFTVPLIRPPEPPSEAWLALRSATHSGSTPYIPSSDDDGVDGGGGGGGGIQEMELTDAVSRLQAARASFGLGDVGGGEGVENSFTSTEDSFIDEDVGDGEERNQTVNVTQLMRRVSLGPSADSTMTSVFSSQEQSREEAINQAVPESRPSAPFTGSQEQSSIPEPPPTVPSTDPGSLYPEVPPDDYPTGSTPNPTEPVSSPDRPPVFSAPQPTASEAQSVPATSSLTTSIPEPLNFTFNPKPRFPASPARSRSTSPAKAPQSLKKFTAAFAPPVARPSRKQPNDALDTPDPSPGKRPAERLSITPGRGTGAVRVLMSPSKDSPLQLASFHGETGPSKRPSVGVRWPPGYSAQRKSLGNVFPNPPTTTTISPTRKSTGQPASLTSFDDPEGREQYSELPTPLGDIPNLAFLRRKSSAHTLDDQNTQPDHDNDVQQRSEVEEEGVEDSQGPRISIEQFFEMTGIRFMDDIAAPRRSVVNPSVLRPSRRASMEAQIPLAEYVVAMAVNVPQLELYSHEAGEEAQKATPPLFQEFVSTDESGQAELLHQLKLIKVHNHAQAKSEWYDWKAQWVEQLYQKTNEGFKNLETDAKTLEGIIRQAQDIVPALQQEYDELMAELEREKAEVAELERCDRNYLNELKATLAEQSAELDTYHADVKEAQTKLDRLHEKFHEVRSQKKGVMAVVEDAERRIHIQKNSTRAEIFHLKDELEALQSLHMWRAIKVQPDLSEFIFASTYNVSIPCINFRPVCAQIQISRTEDIKTKTKEVSPVLSALILRTAKQLVTGDEGQSIRQIIQRLGDYWSSCAQLQAQLKLLSIRFPLSIEETASGFSASAIVLFPRFKAKVLILFIFDTPMFSSWPMLIESMRCDVRVAYGPVDRDTILKAVMGRMQQATPVSDHGCLLDVCMEAIECFA